MAFIRACDELKLRAAYLNVRLSWAGRSVGQVLTMMCFM